MTLMNLLPKTIGSLSMAELMDGTVDLALGPPYPGSVEGFKVDDSRIVALVGNDHHWALRSEITIAELQDQPPLLVWSHVSFSRSAAEHACHAMGFEPRVKLESASTLALARLAVHGVGVALIPDALVPGDFGGRILPISGADDVLCRGVWLCCREGALSSPSVAAFVVS